MDKRPPIQVEALHPDGHMVVRNYHTIAEARDAADCLESRGCKVLGIHATPPPHEPTWEQVTMNGRYGCE